ncbi:uncharacterized protein TNCV_3496461 [Trichonephila clavipes]|nr:uncharacterized protein TNCV_3496461 [Trichonephila clavipes]
MINTVCNPDEAVNYPTEFLNNIIVPEKLRCPSGIVVSDIDCCATGPGFESRRRQGCFRHGGTLNSYRAKSPLVRLVKGEERWEAPDLPQGVLSQNWGGTDQNCTVPCMVLKATANDERKNLAPCYDKFRGP